MFDLHYGYPFLIQGRRSITLNKGGGVVDRCSNLIRWQIRANKIGHEFRFPFANIGRLPICQQHVETLIKFIKADRGGGGVPHPYAYQYPKGHTYLFSSITTRKKHLTKY